MKPVEVHPAGELDRAASLLKAGGCLVYPTETFYALGASVANQQALARINATKRRPQSKPLPVIIGDLTQLRLVAADDLEQWPGFETARGLMKIFWPGPLSIIMPGRPELSAVIKDQAGLVSVRLTPHPQARELCRLAQSPLAATSANLSGQAPISRHQDLDPEVRRAVDMVLAGWPQPAGGLASTLVSPKGPGELVVLRPGALPVDRLVQAGFRLVAG